MGPLFYTSYASSTGDRGPVQRFHFDVQNEIHTLLGRLSRHEGRLQRPTPSPGPDPSVLTCRSLLVLYSADYLTDRRCALEWSVFRERMERRQWLTGHHSDALIGVLWRTDALVLPQEVADTGQLLEDVEDGYQGPGVAGLQDDTGARQRYRALVRRVAERLTRAARIPLPAMTEQDGTAVKPCFGPDRERFVARHQPPPPPPVAELRLVLVLLAGTRDGMERLRESADCYAETAEEWRPFWPHSDEPAAGIAGWAARERGVDRLTVVTLDGVGQEELSEVADAAVVVVLVDPWMTGDSSFSVHWERLARSGARVSAVISVLPRQDRETRRASGRLREALARTPARDLGASHHEAGSPEALSLAMAAVLADAHTDAEEGEAPPHRADEPLLETAGERLARRQQERAGWLRRREPWPPLVTRAPRESWGGG